MSTFGQGPPTAISAPPSGYKARRPCLLVLAGPEIGRIIELGHEPVEIGRSEECTLSVDSDVVSRRHARIQLIFGLYFVTDLESANGTFVGEQRVTMAELKDGDKIRVGDCVLKFVENYAEVEYAQHAMSLASRDVLTETHNKRYFDEIFPRELGRALHGGTPLSLVLFDVDHFKRINDGFGHQAGDLALRSVVECVRGVLASETVLCRIGGEEFAVLLPHVPRSIALAVAERLRTAIASLHFEYQGAGIPLTVSAGVGEFQPPETAEQFFQRVDRQLYAAKSAGRNRVV